MFTNLLYWADSIINKETPETQTEQKNKHVKSWKAMFVLI